MTRSTLFIIVLGAFVTLSIGIYQQITRTGPKIVFCDVGQGSATYIRTTSGADILIDAGPANGKITRCLAEFMPFFDRTIELVLISHDQADHSGGIAEITNNKFQIHKSISNIQFTKNKVIRVGRTVIRSLYPDTSCAHTDKNACSGIYVAYLSPQTCVLLPGDTDALILERTLKNTPVSCSLLAVPHHGSKTGLTAAILSLADPAVAVISVGKNNRYGHPHPSIIDLLKAQNIQIRRTDVEGNILFKFK